jgi:hypothetical protein
MAGHALCGALRRVVYYSRSAYQDNAISLKMEAACPSRILKLRTLSFNI